MNRPKIREVGSILQLLALCVAWAIVTAVALHVSEIVLKTLDMIVELAAISP